MIDGNVDDMGQTNRMVNPSLIYLEGTPEKPGDPLLGRFMERKAWSVKSAFAICLLELRRSAIQRDRFKFVGQEDAKASHDAFREYDIRADTACAFLSTEGKTSETIDEMMNVHKKDPAIDISRAEAQIDPFKHHILRNIYLQLLFNSASFREFIRALPPNAMEYCYCSPPDSELGLDMLADDLANPDAHVHLTKGCNLLGMALSYARQSFIQRQLLHHVGSH